MNCLQTSVSELTHVWMKSCQNASLCNSFGRKKRKKQCPLICLKCFILCHQGQQPCLHLQQAWKSDHTKLLWLRKTQKDYSVLHILFLHVSKSKYSFPKWILIVLTYQIWETSRTKFKKHSITIKLFWPFTVWKKI